MTLRTRAAKIRVDPTGGKEIPMRMQDIDHAAARRRRRCWRLGRRPSAADDYTIGVSNTVQGNGWREEMICAIKAQALASGEVAKLNIAHRNTDAAGQLEDIRNLISAGVDAIVVNPADPAGIKPRRSRKRPTSRHRRRRRRPGGHRAVGLHHLQQPGRIRLSRRQVAVRADGRQGRRRLHARRRRRFGRQRPRQGLQEGARRVSRTSRSRRRSSPAGSRTRASSRSSTSSPPARRSTASGPRASTT